MKCGRLCSGVYGTRAHLKRNVESPDWVPSPNKTVVLRAGAQRRLSFQITIGIFVGPRLLFEANAIVWVPASRARSRDRRGTDGVRRRTASD